MNMLFRLPVANGRCFLGTLPRFRAATVAALLACFVAAGLAESSVAGVIITPQRSPEGWLKFSWTGSLDLTDGEVVADVGGGTYLYGPTLEETGFLFLQNTSTFNEGWLATGPGGRWGTGFATAENGSTGNSTLLLWNNLVYLDSEYVSGSPLTGTMTFEGYTYEEAGLIPGNYTWTLAGSGDTVVMQVAPVPEPSTFAMALAGIACGGYSMWRRRKRRRRDRSRDTCSSLSS